PSPGVLSGPLDGRLAEPHAGHLVEQLGPLLEAIGDRPGQGGDPLQGRGQAAGRQPHLAIEGEQARAAEAAEIIGAVVADRAHQAQGGVRAVGVELGRLAAVRTGHAGALVSVFFSSRRWIALAAILWARARILNSLSPK